ncbi:putative internal virion protein [Burkholderia phage AMP1]|uniref:Internal virion protein n=5 Tax=Ampunavirus BpAMP1 TaxID=2733589 RepID=A0A0A1I652_9CAUD|nr:internal virion protein [Burkholderia phage Bp-AMP1]QEP52863.1 putative internal virion protein [Burkholderia phage AMP1]CDL65193.1 hypothetical protein [Burkholderia phage Bp-AMP2]CDL65233.1 hypothetical protein [Burkholderia phage Bp-AMP3]CDL65273.1 hypothetical protein [Burkholderia phage Bp-AMP4]CDK30107.1 hypothetical protein [Burkholderia phage Bp-AMP1]
MGWAAFAGAIAGFANTWLTAYAQKAANDAQGMIDNANTYSQNTINQANADAANAVRAANNGFAASQAALSNLTRSISNQSKLEAGGKAEDALTTNILRLQDQTIHGSLESQLRSAEQLGAVRAAAAAAGVGGSTARMLQKTMELTAARAATITEQNAQYQTYDMLQQRAGLVANKIMSLDEGQTFAPIDYNINVAPLVQSPLRAGQFASSVMSQAWLGAANGAMGSLNLASNTGPSQDMGQTGTIGNTPGYSSGATMFGPNTFSYQAPSASSYGVGANSYGFSTGLGGGSNGFFSTGSSSKIADYQLK